MRRREFVAGIGAAVALPAAFAQRPESPRRIGFLLGLSEGDPEAHARVEAFRAGLAAAGWTDPGNVRIDYRFTGGDFDRIGAYVTELMALGPDVIVAHSTPIVAALKAATSTIPILFVAVNDPVGQGFVASLAHPGGNITGFSFVDFEMIGKCLGLLKEVAPGITSASLLFDPDLAPYFQIYVRELQANRASLPVDILAAPVRGAAEVEQAVSRLGTGGSLIVAPDPFTVVNRDAIMMSVARHGLPAIFTLRQDAVEGALMSYGPDAADMFKRSAVYVDRILKGAKTVELPVQAPIKFTLVINLKTAKTMGISVSPSLLARADEVIE